MSSQVESAKNTPSTAVTSAGQPPLPAPQTLAHAAKFAIQNDKPILLDYYVDSLQKRVVIGVRETGDKILVKSSDEYTSPVQTMYGSRDEYIVITENSIYIVAKDIPVRKIKN